MSVNPHSAMRALLLSSLCVSSFCVSSFMMALMPMPALTQQQGKTLQAKGPVAKVGKKTISAKQFNARVEQLHRQLEGPLPDRLIPLYKQRLIDELIEAHLLDVIQRKKKITIKDKAVDKAIEAYKKQHVSAKSFDVFIQDRYGDMAQFRAHVRTRLLRTKILKDSVKDKVDKAQAKAYYMKHRKEKYTQPAQVRASHILLRVPRRAEKKIVLKAFHRAEKLAKKAQAPRADFAEMAKKHSEGPSKDKGGDLGYFTEDKMVKSFSKAAFELKPGEVSKPVRSQFGYHIIKVFDQRPERIRAFSEVEDEIIQSLQATQYRKAYKSLLRTYTRRLDIERYPQAIVVKDR